MPAAIEKLTSEQLEAHVLALGLQVRQRRKVLGVSVVTAAQSAGMSRDTWHRMEKGAVTVTIGAWFNALTALGLEFRLQVSHIGRVRRLVSPLVCGWPITPNWLLSRGSFGGVLSSLRVPRSIFMSVTSVISIRTT